MFVIQQIILREIRLPLKEPFESSSGVETDRRILLVELHDRSGVVGWGECVALAAPNYTSEMIDTAWITIRDWIAPRVVGREFNAPSEVHPVLDKNILGHSMAKAAIEMAAWELAATLENLPLATLLGGIRNKVGTGIALGIQPSPDVLVERAKTAIAEGYQRVKVKIQPGADIQYVRALFAAVGSDADIMVDANGAYSLEDGDHLRKLDEFGLSMIEQPLGCDDVVRHAKLQKELFTPLCLDESITSLERAEDMVELKSGRIINIKPGRVGGFGPAIAIHDFCQAEGIPVWCGGMLESGIGRAHNVALASLPNFVLPGDLSPSARYWEQDIVTPEWTMDAKGFVRVPLDRPGMGVGVDTARVDALTVRTETVAAA
jgi:O-succinylbenzoate synthase